MHRTKISGFTVIEATLILVIIAILGFAGWYVWHSKQITSKAYKGATKTSQGAGQTVAIKTFDECEKVSGSRILTTYPAQCVTKDGKTFTDTSNSQQKYLTIKEWDVKVKLSQNILDAYYQTSSFDPGFVFLSTESLRNTSCSANNDGGGYFKRFTEKEMDYEAKRSYLSEYPGATKLGDYYYGFGINPAYQQCSSDSTVQRQADAARNEFKTSLQGIETVN